MKTITEFNQNTPEWHQWREYKISGKSAHKLLKTEKMNSTELKELAKILYPESKNISKLKVDELVGVIKEAQPGFEREKQVAVLPSEDMSTWDDLQWEVLASELFSPSELYLPGERPSDRGTRLEMHAQLEFAGKHNVDVKNIGGIQIENTPISASTDGYAIFEKPHNHVVFLEIKCLGGGRHLKAVFHKEAGLTAKELLASFGSSTSIEQVLQIFVINEKCNKVCVVFFNPDMQAHTYKELWITRADYLQEINAMITGAKQRVAVGKSVADRLLGLEF